MSFRSNIFILLTFFFSTFFIHAQPLSPSTQSVLMRDGKSLSADVYLPNPTDSFPVILIQTPYNKDLYKWKLPLGIGINLATSNYAFVIADWRCFYGSVAACTTNVDSKKRGEDGYDLVEWIAQQTWSNNKIGTWGPSALGKVQFWTAREKPPSLDCIVPQVAGTQFNYEEYFPGGAARTEYIDQLDQLGFGISASIIPHPTYDIYWQFAESGSIFPNDIKVPVYMIGGWYDHNVDLMMDLFDTLKAVAADVKILMGPWVHGGNSTAYIGTEQQGELTYPEASGWSDSLAFNFFDYHLRGINNNWTSEPDIRYFQMGSNEWKNTGSWPPSQQTNSLKYYFTSGKTLQTSAPTSTDSISYIYDPTNPSPTHGGTTLRSDQVQGPHDQKDTVETRNDLIIFSSEILTSEITITGKPHISLEVTSDQFDTDFSVRLTDVYDDGRSVLIADGIIRMRFRNGYNTSDTGLIVPNKKYIVSIELPNVAYTYLIGHKIRLDVSSSNYPKYNRNMNTGGEMYPANNIDTLINPVQATNTVYISSNSYVEFPVFNNAIGIDKVKNDSERYSVIYPNPSNDNITILFKLPFNDKLQVTILNRTGKIVRIIENQTVNYDKQRITLSTEDLPSGVYFIEITGQNFHAVEKLIVIH